MNPTVVIVIAALLTLEPGALFLAKAGFEWAAFGLGTIGVLPLLIACWQITYFSVTDPDRLQREEHVERKIALRQQAIGVNQDNLVAEIPVSNLLIGNPELGGVNE